MVLVPILRAALWTREDTPTPRGKNLFALSPLTAKGTF